jgi:hypothetical protein
MTYRDLEQGRLRGMASDRRRRRVVGTLLPAVLIIGATVAVSVFLAGPSTGDARPPQGTVVVPEGGMMISFGAGRTPLTRTLTVQPSTTTSRKAPPATPGAFLVRLESDLTDADSGRQFPAQQVTVAASEVSAGVLALTVSADPWAPERIAPGEYHGRISVLKDDVRTVVPLVLTADDRGGASALVAVLILVAGAAAGLLIKWITERLTPQAMIHRRLAALRRAVGWGADGRNLPGAALLRMEELQDVIARQDYGRAEQLFAGLEAERERLASISGRFSVLNDILSAQAQAIGARQEPVPRHLLARVDAVLDECHRRLRDAQGAPWPETADDTARTLDALRLNFITATQVITSFLSLPNEDALRSAIDLLQRGDYDGATAEYNRFVQAGTVENGGASQGGKIALLGWLRRFRRSAAPSRPQEPRLSPWFRLARPIAGLASVLVVALVGLKLQYLDNRAFQGDLTAWVTLGLWGFVVELSGTSVIEVVSRLGGHGAGPQPTSSTRV